MPKRIRPHPTFRLFRPDEIAETMEGVDTVLYTALWALVPLYTCGMTNEEREEPTPGVDSVARFWRHLSDEHKAKLNALAKAEEHTWAIELEKED